MHVLMLTHELAVPWVGAWGGMTLTLRVQVPNNCVGLIIGSGGENIRNMEMRTGDAALASLSEPCHPRLSLVEACSVTPSTQHKTAKIP